MCGTAHTEMMSGIARQLHKISTEPERELSVPEVFSFLFEFSFSF